MRSVTFCLLLWLLHCTSEAAAPVQAGSMPEWVVPVLRLVSATHVEPTTGIVLSTDGLVLVPGAFVARGDEIVILDGGTDIIRHGRPARPHRNFPELGVTVLQADGLQRPGAPLAPVSPAEDDSLRLRAFPPAEQIAEGALPLDMLTTVSGMAESGAPLLAADPVLPNVTGALLDHCGNLAGLSLADGVQSLRPTRATEYLWATDLYAVFAKLRLPVSGMACTRDTAVVENTPATAAAASERPQKVDGSTAAEAKIEKTEAETEQPAKPPTAEISGAEPAPSLKVLPPIEKPESLADAHPLSPPPKTSRRARLWLIAALLLLFSGVAVHWLRRRGQARSFPVDSHEAEGDDAAEAPAKDATPAARHAGEHTCRLILRGAYSNGRSFEVSTSVNAQAIDAEIGRGAADLAIDSPVVSRRHARLSGTPEVLTLTDLGSSNGSSINGVPCLEGEVMFIEPGAVLVLGDARFTIAIEHDGPEAVGT